MNSMASGTSEVGNAFLKLLDKAFEDKSHKKIIGEEKLKIQQDRITTMDISSMTLDQVAYIEHKRVEILQKILEESSAR